MCTWKTFFKFIWKAHCPFQARLNNSTVSTMKHSIPHLQFFSVVQFFLCDIIWEIYESFFWNWKKFFGWIFFGFSFSDWRQKLWNGENDMPSRERKRGADGRVFLNRNVSCSGRRWENFKVWLTMRWLISRGRHWPSSWSQTLL